MGFALMGFDSWRSGQSFESVIEDQNAILAQQRRCRVFKVPTARLHRGRAVKKSWVDFSGVLDGGAAVAMEAKSVKGGPSFALAGLTDFQRGVLRDVDALGGVALLLVHCRQPRAVFVVPWGVVAATLETRKSLRFDAIPEWRAQPGETWLDVVDRYW